MVRNRWNCPGKSFLCCILCRIRLCADKKWDRTEEIRTDSFCPLSTLNRYWINRKGSGSGGEWRDNEIFTIFWNFLHPNGEHMIIVGYVSWFQLHFDTNCRRYQRPSLIYPLTIWRTVCKTKNLRGVTALFLHWRIIISPRTVSNKIELRIGFIFYQGAVSVWCAGYDQECEALHLPQSKTSPRPPHPSTTETGQSDC